MQSTRNILRTLIAVALACAISCFLAVGPARAQGSGPGTPAYGLALLQKQSEDPDNILSLTPVEPDRATLTEFHWILQALENRSLESQDQIAATILDAWQLIHSRGYAESLLDVARALSSYARNTALFGAEKVAFSAIAGLWASTHKPPRER